MFDRVLLILDVTNNKKISEKSKTSLFRKYKFIIKNYKKGNALCDPEISSEVEKVISSDRGIAETLNEFFVNKFPVLKFHRIKFTKYN